MKATKNGYNPEYSENAPTLDEIQEVTGNVILEFGAPWCSHCQATQPIAKKILSQYPNLPHTKLYDGKGKVLGRAFKVKQWPTFILLLNGNEVDRLVRPIELSQLKRLLPKTII